jgi:hypothetical protein
MPGIVEVLVHLDWALRERVRKLQPFPGAKLWITILFKSVRCYKVPKSNDECEPLEERGHGKRVSEGTMARCGAPASK